MKKYNPVKTSKPDIDTNEAKIHQWLKDNRPGYNAERWCIAIENYSAPGEFTIPLPPEKDKIFLQEELTNMLDEPLPITWFPPSEMI